MLGLVIFLVLLIIGLYFLLPWLQRCMNEKMRLIRPRNQTEEYSSDSEESKDGNKTIEKWANYRTPYYDYARTGNDPLMFYTKPVYRKPYRWPFTFYKSYPYPHMTYYELL